MRINNQSNKQNFKALSPIAKPLGQFYNANATLPTLIIETGVTLGRANEANKRGGMPEAVDRLVEQGVSAVVWVYGVNILKNIGNFIGKNFLGIESLNFDIGFDELRNPLKHIDKKAIGFKAGNILASTAIATYFIGAILPKINNAILRKTLKKQENQNKKEDTIKMPSFNDFQNTTKRKDISFRGGLSDGAINLAHILENNSTARLLITDTGVVAGRFANAPNKYRKIEGLFRDIASIYFYLLSGAHVVGLLNKATKNTNIDPKILEKTVEMLNKNIGEDGIDFEQFKAATSALKDEKTLKAINELFVKNTTIKVEDFIKKFKGQDKKALDMAKLQPIIEGKGVLTKMQALDVLSTSWTSNPEFLKKAFAFATDGASDDKLRFVSRKSLEKMRTSIDNFTSQILSEAQKNNTKITKEFIEKTANKALRKNFAFNCIATAVSIFALGVLIPKIQYAITRKLTNENKFHTEEE